MTTSRERRSRFVLSPRRRRMRTHGSAEGRRGPAGAAPAAEQKRADNVVQVSEEMLRDLRITTSTVELHRGGEASSLLGELGVNLNAYAEVSAPLPARVVSLQAVEGQTRASGRTTGDPRKRRAGQSERRPGDGGSEARPRAAGARPEAWAERREDRADARGAGGRKRDDRRRGAGARRPRRAPDRLARRIKPAQARVRRRWCFVHR